MSVILPTYNESQNITQVIELLERAADEYRDMEVVVVDDDSADGTGSIAEDLREKKSNGRFSIKVIHRKAKKGLSSAILDGIRKSTGKYTVVMDSDLSHPPSLIPRMINALRECDIVIASRYVRGGATVNWPFKRRLISKGATKIAHIGLGIKQLDPMSGFFACKRCILDTVDFDAIGYKMLLEILVKTKGTKVMEIPYTFQDRANGLSKFGASTAFDYLREVWKLYRYGRNNGQERRTSAKFISKAGRFFTVGASGLGINYLTSLILTLGFIDVWYLHANVAGIAVSMTSNFFLNKVWTFENKNFVLKPTLDQYWKFILFSSLGAAVQIGLVYYLVDGTGADYPLALLAAVAVAAFGNFVLNKHWTFGEKIWS